MRWKVLLAGLVVACGASPPPAAPPAPVDPPPVQAPTPRKLVDMVHLSEGEIPPIPEEDVGNGALAVSARVLKPKEALELTFVRPGRGSCYKQGPVETTFEGHVVTHRYTTTTEGKDCVDGLVPGGFHTRVTFPEAGSWEGQVFVDGKQASAYFVDVGGP